MMSRYKVWLNGESLEEISPKIYVSDIAYKPMTPTYSSNRIGAADGQLVGGADYVDLNSVSVSFMVREYSTTKRQLIIQNIIRWATKGGWLTTSDRDGMRMYVRCSRYPAINSVMRWLDYLTVEFTAFELPYWTSIEPVKVILQNGDTDMLILGGARRSFVEASIHASAALSSVSITVGDTSVSLTGLSIAGGDDITISYTDDHHILEIKHGTTSILDKRTAASSDDLIAEIGENNVSFTASGTASCTLFVREVYL